jgi:hypothetical protein
MKKAIRKLGMGSSLALSLVLPASAQQAPTADSVILLDQAWSKEDREWYYNFSQGSAMVAYDLFLNMEVADSQDLFRNSLGGASYGFVPNAVNASNPDGLPIGVTKTNVATTIKGWPAGDYVGINCAACHEGQLRYKGKLIRIEGGVSNTINYQGMVIGLNKVLLAHLTDAAKFDRLAARLGASTPDAKDKLRKRIESERVRVNEYARTSATPHPWGPGRVDAFTMIVDRVTATMPGIPENWSMGIAPVKPPFLWNAPQGLWTQWAASQQNPIPRNYGETLGVFLPVDLSSKSPAEGLFQSNGAILELQRVESQLGRLAPPSWPEDVLGKIDRDKAKVGKALFMENCATCHNAWPYRWTEPNKYGKRFVLVGLVPQTYVGTDRSQFESLKPLAFTGELSKFLPPVFRGKPFLPPLEFLALLGTEARETAIRKLKLTEAQELDLHGYRELPTPRPPEHVYKAAPRDGVWATPPFMHNGSVPNLYEMLIPAAERTKKFNLGGDFDPVKVGLDTSATSGTFLMDTTLLGNSNAGHSFQDGPRGNGIIGPLFSDDQRWALLEYLKSIPETPGRVTPFGGPPEGQLPQK